MTALKLAEPTDRWWCEGQDCGGETRRPHVHCAPWGGKGWHTHLIDPDTGQAIT